MLDVLYEIANKDDNADVRKAALNYLGQARHLTSLAASDQPNPQGRPQGSTNLTKTEAGQIEEVLCCSRLDKSVWERYFGALGKEPVLPPNIEDFMNSPCPFWSRNKVRDTHLLVLIPSQVGGKALTLDYLQELIKNPQGGGHKTGYNYYLDDAYRGSRRPKSI